MLSALAPCKVGLAAPWAGRRPSKGAAAKRQAAPRPPAGLPRGARQEDPGRDPHSLLNKGAEEAEEEGRETEGGQPELEPPKRRSSKGAGGGGGGGGGRRRKKDDPHRLLNVDVDPMESDPGDVGRVAPGVLEKYEHLDKLRTHEGEGEAGGSGGAAPAAAGGAAAGEPGAAAEGGAPCDVINLTMYYTEPVAPYLSPEYAAAAAAAAVSPDAPAGAGEGGEGGAAAESDTLKTDAPGAGETQHPGSWPAAGELQAETEAASEAEDPGMAKE